MCHQALPEAKDALEDCTSAALQVTFRVLHALFSRSIDRLVGQAVTYSSLKFGLRFKSGAGQIRHSVANGSPPLQHFFEIAVLSGRNDAKMGPANSLHASA